MNDDTKLNRILGQRFMPPPATNLANRISAAAANTDTPSRSMIDEIMMMLVVPRPAYVMGLCLVLGLLLGVQLNGTTDIETQDLFFFVDIEEEWL